MTKQNKNTFSAPCKVIIYEDGQKVFKEFGDREKVKARAIQWFQLK